MKTITIFMVLCVVLLLLFTSLSYGWWAIPQPIEPQADPTLKHQKDRLPEDPPIDRIDPKLREDPWDSLKSPPVQEDENSNVVTIVIDLGFCHIIFTF